MDLPKLLNYHGWIAKVADLHAFVNWGSLSPSLCEFLCKSLREGLDDQCMLYKYYDVKNVAGMKIDPDKYGLHLFPFRTYSEKWCLVAVNRSQRNFGMWFYIPDDVKCLDPFPSYFCTQIAVENADLYYCQQKL